MLLDLNTGRGLVLGLLPELILIAWALLLTLHAAWRIDQDGARAARVDISLIKFFGAKVLLDVLDRAIQVHGGLGVTDDTPLSFMWRQARSARIYDGPDEVHKLVVARQRLKGA